MLKQFFILSLSLAFCSTSFANIETVKSKLAQQYPNVKIDNLQTTEMVGLYSGTLENQVIYVNEEAQHLFIGSMIRLKDQKNLTKDLMMKQNPIDWKSLPLQDAIKTVRGTGKRQLAVFSDPNCPYCKRLEEDLKKLNDVTIYTFIFPIKPQSVAVSKDVWCSENRAYAWQNLMEKSQAPKNKSCDNPIERNLALGKKLGLSGTPTLVFSNGWKVMGAASADEIEKVFKQMQ